jgi:hypothetical protein
MTEKGRPLPRTGSAKRGDRPVPYWGSGRSSRSKDNPQPHGAEQQTPRHIGASTVAGWLAQHKDLMSYLRLRDKGRHLFPPEQTIRSIKLYHRQIYRYAFHRPKLEFLRHGELDDIRDREALGAMLAEVAGKQASETHLTATGAKKKGIIRMALDGNGRAKKDNWKPKWMAFPQAGYTKRALTSKTKSGA